MRAPSADPKQRQVDYWGHRAEVAEAEVKRLREALMKIRDVVGTSTEAHHIARNALDGNVSARTVNPMINPDA